VTAADEPDHVHNRHRGRRRTDLAGVGGLGGCSPALRDGGGGVEGLDRQDKAVAEPVDEPAARSVA